MRYTVLLVVLLVFFASGSFAQLKRPSDIQTDKLEYTQNESMTISFHSAKYGYYWHNGGGCGGGMQYQISKVDTEQIYMDNGVMCCLLIPEEGYTKHGSFQIDLFNYPPGNYHVALIEKVKRKLNPTAEEPMHGRRLVYSNEFVILPLEKEPVNKE